MIVCMHITISPSVRETKSEVKLTEQNETPVTPVGVREKREYSRILFSEATPRYLNEVKLTGCRVGLSRRREK